MIRYDDIYNRIIQFLIDHADITTKFIDDEFRTEAELSDVLYDRFTSSEIAEIFVRVMSEMHPSMIENTSHPDVIIGKAIFKKII